MSRLPPTGGRQARKAFEKAGWVFNRQRGSHMILTHPEIVGNLTVPDHAELDRGTLRRLIRDAGLSVDEFARQMR